MKGRRDAWWSLGIGLTLALGGLAALALTYVSDFDHARRLLFQTGVHLAFGREVSIPAGIAAGLRVSESAIAATTLEWAMLFTLFPLIILFGERLHRIERVRKFLDKAEVRARENPSAGILALGALTLMPGLPVGALTSAFIGESLRLPTKRLLPMLAGAELFANATIAIATATFASRFQHPHFAAAGLAIAMLVGALAFAFWPRRTAAPAV